MKRVFTILLLMCGSVLGMQAQLTIDECQAKARENFPLIKRYDLIKKSQEYTLSNVGKGYLPQFAIMAKASYQSDVTSLPISLPGIEVPSLPKDQYNAYIDVSQTVWDGGAVRAQKKIANSNAKVEQQQVDVDLYAIQNRVNQLFFGILLLNAQLNQNQILQDELQRNFETISSYIEYGIANQADLDAVKVEQLKTKQSLIQIQSNKKAYMDMLSYMIGEPINDNTSFVKPMADNLIVSNEVNRPELQLFESQNNLFESQKSMIKSSYMPRINLFLQGGIGRPALNMLNPDFDTYYIGGVRLAWNFSALYTQKNDIRKIELNQNNIATLKETFLYNTTLEITRENQEIKRLKNLMEDDDEIISLRENIRKSAQAKVSNGTMTVTELMREISSEDLARQTKITHEIELLMAIYNLKNTTNNH